MALNSTRLMLGTIALSIVYVLFGPRDIDKFFAITTPIEAGTYSIIILIAFNIRNIKLWFFLPVISALANYIFVVMLWPFVTALPTLASESLNLFSTAYHPILVFSFYSFIGALFYCFLLDFLIFSSQLTIRTYILVTILCLFAGIPMALQEFNVTWYLAAHKAMWWIMFSIGLLLSDRITTKGLADHSLDH